MPNKKIVFTTKRPYKYNSSYYRRVKFYLKKSSGLKQCNESKIKYAKAIEGFDDNNLNNCNPSLSTAFEEREE